MTAERQLEIALQVLEQHPELADKWAGLRKRFNDAGVTRWLT